MACWKISLASSTEPLPFLFLANFWFHIFRSEYWQIRKKKKSLIYKACLVSFSLMCVQVPSDVKPRRAQFFFFFWHENHCTLFFFPALLFSFLLALCAHNSNQSTCITVIILVVASFRFNVYVIASPFYIAALGFRSNTSSYQLTEGEEALSPDRSVSISLFLTSLCLHFTNWHYTSSLFFCFFCTPLPSFSE